MNKTYNKCLILGLSEASELNLGIHVIFRDLKPLRPLRLETETVLDANYYCAKLCMTGHDCQS